MQEYPDFSESGNNPAKITPFVLGAVVGAGIALLLAPAHGRDTRKRVGTTMRKWGDGARHVFQKTRDNLNDVKNDARQAIDKGRQEYMRSREGRTSSTSSTI